MSWQYIECRRRLVSRLSDSDSRRVKAVHLQNLRPKGCMLISTTGTQIPRQQLYRLLPGTPARSAHPAGTPLFAVPEYRTIGFRQKVYSQQRLIWRTACFGIDGYDIGRCIITSSIPCVRQPHVSHDTGSFDIQDGVDGCGERYKKTVMRKSV